MPPITTTTLFAVFLATALLFAAFWILATWWVNRSRVALRRRIGSPDDSDPTILLDEMVGGGRGPWWARLWHSLGERMERTELGFSAAEALAIILLCGGVLAAGFFFWRQDEGEAWLAIPAFLVGAAVPLGFFLWRQRSWRRRLQDQLPDMIFLMARSLRAGMSIDQSMGVMGKHGVAPLSREFARMHRQLELGLALPQVLKSEADRLNLVDFSVFASVLSLHRSTGGNLPVIMDRLAETTRDHNQMRGHYRTATALGRFSTAIIFALVSIVVFYLFFFERDLASRYFDSTTGLTLFLIGMGMQVLALVALMILLRRDEV
jgi:Flp pilus assembly protein TadB